MVGLICCFEYQRCEAKDEMGSGFEDVSKKVVEMIGHRVQVKKGRGMGGVNVKTDYWTRRRKRGQAQRSNLQECRSREGRKRRDLLKVGGMSSGVAPGVHSRDHSHTSPCCTGRQV